MYNHRFVRIVALCVLFIGGFLTGGSNLLYAQYCDMFGSGSGSPGWTAWCFAIGFDLTDACQIEHCTDGGNCGNKTFGYTNSFLIASGFQCEPAYTSCYDRCQ